MIMRFGASLGILLAAEAMHSSAGIPYGAGEPRIKSREPKVQKSGNKYKRLGARRLGRPGRLFRP